MLSRSVSLGLRCGVVSCRVVQCGVLLCWVRAAALLSKYSTSSSWNKTINEYVSTKFLKTVIFGKKNTNDASSLYFNAINSGDNSGLCYVMLCMLCDLMCR